MTTRTSSPRATGTTTVAASRCQLCDLRVGQCATICAVNAAPQLTRRLGELGLRPGVPVTIAQKTSGGGRVVKLGSTRYALGTDALRQIEVSA